MSLVSPKEVWWRPVWCRSLFRLSLSSFLWSYGFKTLFVFLKLWDLSQAWKNLLSQIQLRYWSGTKTKQKRKTWVPVRLTNIWKHFFFLCLCIFGCKFMMHLLGLISRSVFFFLFNNLSIYFKFKRNSYL